MNSNPNPAGAAAHVTVRTTTANDRLERLISLIETLSHVLDQETQAVRRRDYGSIDALNEQKSRLTDSYGEQVRDLSANAPAEDEIEPRLAHRLRDKLRGFLGLVEANARALNAAKTAHERFIKSISDAVSAKAQSIKGYSSAGTYGLSAAPGRNGTPPIALNETI